MHSFIVADVQECILGIDFLKNNSLLLDASKNALLLPQTLTYVDSEALMPKPLMPPDIRVDPVSPFAKADEIYGNDISFLNEDLKTLLRRHPESLNKQVFKQEPKHSYRMKIELSTEEPVFVKPRRLPLHMEGPAMRIVDELCELGVVMPTTSCYNSPGFLVKKSRLDAPES